MRRSIACVVTIVLILIAGLCPANTPPPVRAPAALFAADQDHAGHGVIIAHLLHRVLLVDRTGDAL